MEQIGLTSEWVELTKEEKLERGHRLADLLRARRLMLEEHKANRKRDKDELAAFDAELLLIEDMVRTGREERPKG